MSRLQCARERSRKATRSCRATSNDRSTTGVGPLLGALRSRPGGFPITSLMRPPADGEDGSVFARTRPGGGRPRSVRPPHPLDVADPRAPHRAATRPSRPRRALAAEQGLEPRFFCGGGWYIDARRDGGGRRPRLRRLHRHRLAAAVPAGRRAARSLDQPARVRLDDGRRVLELPTHPLARRAPPRHSPARCRRSCTCTSTTTSCSSRAPAALTATLACSPAAAALSAWTAHAEREVAWADVCAG